MTQRDERDLYDTIKNIQNENRLLKTQIKTINTNLNTLIEDFKNLVEDFKKLDLEKNEENL